MYSLNEKSLFDHAGSASVSSPPSANTVCDSRFSETVTPETAFNMAPHNSGLWLLGLASTSGTSARSLGPLISPPTPPPPKSITGFDILNAALTSNNLGGQVRSAFTSTPPQHAPLLRHTRCMQGPNFDDSQEQRYCMPLPKSPTRRSRHPLLRTSCPLAHRPTRYDSIFVRLILRPCSCCASGHRPGRRSQSRPRDHEHLGVYAQAAGRQRPDAPVRRRLWPDQPAE